MRRSESIQVERGAPIRKHVLLYTESLLIFDLWGLFFDKRTHKDLDSFPPSRFGTERHVLNVSGGYLKSGLMAVNEIMGMG